jgi:hypothetical protein
VPVVPVYIREKIQPLALIENLRNTAKPGDEEPELSLFSDFNGIDDFDKKVDFYSHDAGSRPHWSNRMILGDSLLVMTSLAEKGVYDPTTGAIRSSSTDDIACWFIGTDYDGRASSSVMRISPGPTSRTTS